MITQGSELSVARQAKLLGVSRSSVYYRPRPESQEELDLFKRESVLVGRRRIRRLMRKLGLWAVGR